MDEDNLNTIRDYTTEWLGILYPAGKMTRFAEKVGETRSRVLQVRQKRRAVGAGCATCSTVVVRALPTLAHFWWLMAK